MTITVAQSQQQGHNNKSKTIQYKSASRTTQPKQNNKNDIRTLGSKKINKDNT
jgi:hypothetical protein